MADKDPTWELKDENQAAWGTVWWDGKKIQSDKPTILSLLKEVHHSGKGFEDGLEFLKVAPRYFRSGYVTMQRVQ
jgi:hypothetical protein